MAASKVPSHTAAARGSALREAWIFIALTFATTYPLWFYIANDASRARLIPLGMLLPALCAIVTKLVVRGSLRAMGWGIPTWRWLLAGWLVPLGYSTLAYLPLIALPALGGPNAQSIASAVSQFHLGRFPAPSVVAPLVEFLYVATYVTIVSLVTAAGEEIGWRGLLVPAFARAYGERKAAIFSGLIWAAWHYPIVMLGIYHGRNPMWFSIVVFSLAATAAGIFLAWLRLRSHSIWPGVIAHSTNNSIVQSFFDRLIAQTPLNGYLAGEFGVFLMAAIAAVAAWCLPRLRPDLSRAG